MRDITIIIGGAVGYNVSAVRVLHAGIESETEKAVRLMTDNGHTCWLPKKVLIEVDENLYRLAKWFKPDAYADRWLFNHSVVSFTQS